MAILVKKMANILYGCTANEVTFYELLAKRMEKHATKHGFQLYKPWKKYKLQKGRMSVIHQKLGKKK